LLGSGGWQVVQSVKVWRARRHEPPEAQDESESKALTPAKGAPASLAQRPWITLMKRRPDGDPIERHVRRLMTRFRELDRDKAHAIVIDALVSVCLKKADDQEDLSRYFSRSVTNAAINYVTRHLAKLRACSIEMVPVVDYPDESDGWHFADDTEQRAQNAFCKLSELDQAVIHARVVEELTVPQIGEIIGLSEDGARKAFDRALRRLKENFQKS
jgi:RNA polymerase sigma factor (sigma-70 family)